MKSEGNNIVVEGVFTKEPLIVMINDYKVDVEIEGTMLITSYKDIPGVIGVIGVKLGEYGVNIAKMQVGRKSPGGEAVMVVKVDQNVPENVLNELKKLEYVYEAVAVNL
jgi:D-3-phosphoglycerate dehydrogenase